MSGEFGQYNNGYFYTQMQYAAEDCVDGDYEITRRWGEFLEEFQHVARAISWAEAGDSGQHHAIAETMRRLPELKVRLCKIEEYVDVFREIADEAARNAVEKGGN